MATRSLIGIQESDGKIQCVYCHGSGYPEHQLPILISSYNTEIKVRELLNLGDLSYIDEQLYDCFAYMRDGGEEGCEALISNNRKQFFEAGKNCDAEYCYLYVDGDWLVFKRRTSKNGAWGNYGILSLDRWLQRT